MSKPWMLMIMGCVLVGSVLSASAAEEDQVDLVLGGGLLFSSDYDEFIDDAYGSAGYSDAGGTGWVDFYGGVEFHIDEQLALLLGCDALVNTVDANGGLLNETYANLILAPSVYGQLYLTPEQTVYVNGGFSLPLPATGSDYFELENNGIGIGANIGVRLAEVFRIEAGYLYLPVTAKATSSNPVYAPGTQEDYNFGGLMFRALLSF